MKQFLAVYTGTAASRQQSGWDALPEADRRTREQAGMAAWQKWMADNAAVVTVSGGPLGKTKSVTRTGISDTSNHLAGYVVVQAESHQAAAKLFENHPHFSIFPGDGVEVMECLPIPDR